MSSMAIPVIRPNWVYVKDPTEKRTIEFDWDTEFNLATGVTIAASTFAITVEPPHVEASPDLTVDGADILTGDRKTAVQLIGGTLGARYRLTNHITTNETPPQEKDKSVFVYIWNQ